MVAEQTIVGVEPVEAEEVDGVLADEGVAAAEVGGEVAIGGRFVGEDAGLAGGEDGFGGEREVAVAEVHAEAGAHRGSAGEAEGGRAEFGANEVEAGIEPGPGGEAGGEAGIKTVVAGVGLAVIGDGEAVVDLAGGREEDLIGEPVVEEIRFGADAAILAAVGEIEAVHAFAVEAGVANFKGEEAGVGAVGVEFFDGGGAVGEGVIGDEDG